MSYVWVDFNRTPTTYNYRWGICIMGGIPMTIKHKLKKSVEIPRRLPPIVVVPDKTYIDDAGDVIPTDVILLSDPTMYMQMQLVLEAWGKEQMGIPGQRGIIKG